jgi:hypothetical protein
MLLVVLAAVPWSPLPLRPASRDGGRGGPPGARAGGARLRPGPDLGDAPTDPVDPAVVVDLAAAALAAGASIPGALAALGEALGEEGRPLRRAGSLLLLGAPWPEARAAVPDRLRVLADALEPAWVDGIPAGPLLRHAGDRIRAGQARAAEEAAARLGVRLVLPLGLCFLPAFVLLGLLPVLLSTGLGLAG